MNNLSILDFPGVIQKSFGSVKTFDIETAEYVIVENFEKGFLTEEIFLESMDLLEKGKRGSIGEIREWNGKKFMKTANGWKPVKGEGKQEIVTDSEDGKSKIKALEKEVSKLEKDIESKGGAANWGDTHELISQKNRTLTKIHNLKRELKGLPVKESSEKSMYNKYLKAIKRMDPEDIGSEYGRKFEDAYWDEYNRVLDKLSGGKGGSLPDNLSNEQEGKIMSQATAAAEKAFAQMGVSDWKEHNKQWDKV